MHTTEAEVREAQGDPGSEDADNPDSPTALPAQPNADSHANNAEVPTKDVMDASPLPTPAGENLNKDASDSLPFHIEEGNHAEGVEQSAPTKKDPSQQLSSRRSQMDLRSCLRGSRATVLARPKRVTWNDTLNTTRKYNPYPGEHDMPPEWHEQLAKNMAQRLAEIRVDARPEDAERSANDFAEQGTGTEEADGLTGAGSKGSLEKGTQTHEKQEDGRDENGPDDTHSYEIGRPNYLTRSVLQPRDWTHVLDRIQRDVETAEQVSFEWTGLTNQQINELIFFGEVYTI